MFVNYIFLYISTIATGFSGAYLIYKALIRRSLLWGSIRWLYGILGIVELYYFTIYTLVITHVMPFESYAGFIRPIAFIMLMSPALMAIAHRQIHLKLPKLEG
jgi:hypothetical protein